MKYLDQHGKEKKTVPHLDKNNLLLITTDDGSPRYLTDKRGLIAYPCHSIPEGVTVDSRASQSDLNAVCDGLYEPVVTREQVRHKNIDCELINGKLFHAKLSKGLKKGVEIKHRGKSAIIRDANGVCVAGLV